MDIASPGLIARLDAFFRLVRREPAPMLMLAVSLPSSCAAGAHDYVIWRGPAVHGKSSGRRSAYGFGRNCA